MKIRNLNNSEKNERVVEFQYVRTKLVGNSKIRIPTVQKKPNDKKLRGGGGFVGWRGLNLWLGGGAHMFFVVLNCFQVRRGCAA